MRIIVPVFAAAALLLSPAASIPQDRPDHSNRFDGKWQTTVTCSAIGDAQAFTWRFISEVKDGNLRGLQGVEGKPASLLIEGTIGEDGVGRLYATGHTGQKQYVPGDTPVGTEFNYHIRSQFGDRTGTGTRVEGRPCSFEFEKQ
jgi:hypothetical protein